MGERVPRPIKTHVIYIISRIRSKAVGSRDHARRLTIFAISVVPMGHSIATLLGLEEESALTSRSERVSPDQKPNIIYITSRIRSQTVGSHAHARRLKMATISVVSMELSILIRIERECALNSRWERGSPDQKTHLDYLLLEF